VRSRVHGVKGKEKRENREEQTVKNRE